MVLDITEDGVITCDEAQTVHGWIASERKAYGILKKKINLEMRSIRSEYDLQLKTGDDPTASKEMRIEQAKRLHPLKSLLLAVDELALKADEMDLRATRIIAQCQSSD
jgi:hypothetical protein